VNKEPGLACLLSMVLPGAGQFYSGRLTRGLLLGLTTFGCFGFGFYLLCSPAGNVSLALGLIAAQFGVWAFSCFDAHRCARELNSAEQEAERGMSKDPWIAVLLSVLIPGLGHLYLRRWVLGFFCLILLIPMALLLEGIQETLGEAVLAQAATFIVSLIFQTGFALWAYHVTAAHKRPILAAAKIIVAIVCFSTASVHALQHVRQNSVEPFRIPSGSMIPLFMPGDRILVRKSQPLPPRGSIVVFYRPDVEETLYIKRLVAFGGETIEIQRDGRLCINGVVLSDPPFDTLRYEQQGEHALAGSPFFVPENTIFCLGDNTARSYDSRFFGEIPSTLFHGVAYKIWWPLDRARALDAPAPSR